MIGDLLRRIARAGPVVCVLTGAWPTITPLCAHERPPLTAKQREAVLPIIQQLANALAALRGQYPEFEGIDAGAVLRKTTTSIGVEVSRNLRRPREKRGLQPEDWGTHGVFVSFVCTRPLRTDGDHIHAHSDIQPTREFAHLGLELNYHVLVCPKPSQGVRDRVLETLEHHAQQLDAVNKGHAQPKDQTGRDPTQKEAPMADNVKMEGDKVWIEGVRNYAMCEPLFEAVGVVVRHLGSSHSPEYLQGISGAAFRIAGICPCAPTCSAAMSTTELARTLGYKVTKINMGEACKSWKDLQALAEAYKKHGKTVPEPESLTDGELREQVQRVHAIIDGIKAAIRSGLPVVVWHAFTNAEYDVVTGYDDATGEFLGWGGYGNPKDAGYARAPQGRMIETAYIGGLPNAILIKGPAADYDAQSAEVSALEEAVRHGRSQENLDKSGDKKWHMLQGIACYSRWAREWESPDRKRGAGDSYCFGVYSKTHAAAAQFLREIAPKHGNAREDLERAAQCFESETKVLEGGRDLLWWSAPQGADAERNKKIAALLAEARDHYAEGIAAIEKALAAMD